jgi:flagellar basal body rod protein FlgB
MQLRAPEENHISELLALLVAFTKARRQVLANNINNMDVPGYSPQDLDIDEFSEVMNNAISEYLVHQRILLVDTETVHFGPNLALELESVSDGQAYTLLQHDRQAYVEYQTRSILENALNEQVALKLLKTKQLEPNAHQMPIENRLF